MHDDDGLCKIAWSARVLLWLVTLAGADLRGVSRGTNPPELSLSLP